MITEKDILKKAKDYVESWFPDHDEVLEACKEKKEAYNRALLALGGKNKGFDRVDYRSTSQWADENKSDRSYEAEIRASQAIAYDYPFIQRDEFTLSLRYGNEPSYGEWKAAKEKAIKLEQEKALSSWKRR